MGIEEKHNRPYNLNPLGIEALGFQGFRGLGAQGSFGVATRGGSGPSGSWACGFRLWGLGVSALGFRKL